MPHGFSLNSFHAFEMEAFFFFFQIIGYIFIHQNDFFAIISLFFSSFTDRQYGSTTAILFKMEQLFIQFSYDFFQSIQIRFIGGCHTLLWR